MNAIPWRWGVPPMAAALLLMLPASPIGAAVINLTNDTIGGLPQSTITYGTTTFVGGMVNGALFRRPLDVDDSNAGSGIFRDLYTVDSNAGSEAGYNRDGVMDAKVAQGFDPILTMGDLVEDSTGTAYVFVIDTNEPGNTPAKYISLDDFKVYVGGTTDPAPLPESLGELGAALGVPVYDMNQSGQDNHMLLDYSLYSGSGAMDLFVFVPKAAFGNPAAEAQVFVYSQFGSYSGASGFDPAAGPEQVSIPYKTVSTPIDPLIPFVPEPGAAALLLASVVIGLRRRR